MPDMIAARVRSEAWEQEIRSLEDATRRAFVAVDLATLDRLWSDSFVVNSPLNVVSPKAIVLELLRTGRIGHVTFDATIEHIRRDGDLVVVMGGETVVDRPGEATVHRRFTHVWRQEGGSWRTVARHANVVPQLHE